MPIFRSARLYTTAYGFQHWVCWLESWDAGRQVVCTVPVRSAGRVHCACTQCRSCALCLYTVQVVCTVPVHSAGRVHCACTQCRSCALCLYTVQVVCTVPVHSAGRVLCASTQCRSCALCLYRVQVVCSVPLHSAHIMFGLLAYKGKQCEAYWPIRAYNA